MQSNTRQSKAAGGALALIMAASLMAIGCWMVKSESDVLGDYELRAANGKILLKVSPDRTFSETIYLPNGKVENCSGKWLWTQEGLSFDELWIPAAFAPDYIVQADASATANRQPKYTEPGHWSIPPEKRWGTVTLPIFPDADVSFNMVRHHR